MITYEQQIENLENANERLMEENKRLRQSLIDTLSLFDFDSSPFLSTQSVQSLCPEFYVIETKIMNVVRSKN